MKKFSKKDLTKAVIEIDEVEHVISEKAAVEILKGEKLIILKRIIDQENKLIPIEWINKSLEKYGIIDHLK